MGCNPHPSTRVPKFSISDPPPHQENGLLGIIILYRVPPARDHLLHAIAQITLIP